MFRNKLKEQRGDFAIGLALAMPVIMLLLFLAIDLVQVQVRKTSIQRTMDSASLAVIAEATNKEFYTDADGYIVEPVDSPRLGLMPCQLTQEDLNRHHSERVSRSGLYLDRANCRAVGNGLCGIQSKGQCQRIIQFQYSAI